MIGNDPYRPEHTGSAITRTLRRIVSLLILASIVSASATAQEHERYQQIRIELGSADDISDLPSFDEHSLGHITGGIETILTESDVRALQEKGIRVTILVPDLQRFYAGRAVSFEEKGVSTLEALSTEDTPANFSLGSIAGYYTLEELRNHLNRMHELYPALASEPISIGKSVQGRDILAVRISARPESEELPEILYTGLHHAREPISMMSLVYTMWSLLEGYADNSETASLLENRALWFVPLVNPDGYAYNVEYFPEGGGLWRKNRGGAGSEGIDLNRNYGLTSTWLAPPDGGVDDPLSGSYRGPTPFSEPETRAIRDFVRAHDFGLALNFHSYSNVLVYKHEGTISELADTAWYLTSARELALENGLGHGRGAEAIGYDASGTLDEWLFEEGSESRHIFSWTPEVGSSEDGFWPVPERIAPLCRRMLPMSVRAAWMAGPYLRPVAWESGNFGDSLRIALTVANIGAESMETGGRIMLRGFDETTVSIPALASGESYQVWLSPPKGITDGSASRSQLDLLLRYGSQEWSRTINTLVHPVDSLFVDNFEEALAPWRNNLWGIETSPGRGRVLSDSPYENYFESDIPNVLELEQPVSLVGYDAAELRFEARGVIRGINHHLAIEARRSGEQTWHRLDGEYLQCPVEENSELRSQLRGANREWRYYAVPLDAFAGENVLIRFVMNTPYSGSDNALYDGALIDNLSIVGARDLPTSVADDDSDTGGTSILAWPNPCRDLLHIQSPGSMGTIMVELFDLLGREVISAAGWPVISIDMTGLQEGTYILNIKSGTDVVRRKIMKR